MIAALEWLGLAIEDRSRSRQFYERLLGPPNQTEDSVCFAVGESTLRLHPPGASPRGGGHVHYAFSTGPAGYERYRERLSELGSIEEHDLSVYQSTYAFDPDGHCLEVADRDDAGETISSIFEVVLEVASLEAAEGWYRRLGGDLVDRGTERRRSRLDMGPFELELWEPQRGLAGAQPGRSVDLGIAVMDLMDVIEVLDGHTYEQTDRGIRCTDRDGHILTFVPD